jgi:hypothetical protein
MFALCAVVTLFCCAAVESTFHNFYITVGLGVLMGISSGLFCAADERRQREGHGEG